MNSDDLDPHFRAGYVTLVGEPNVGKSTLMNTLLGQKISIVTSKPQTTRHRILGIYSTNVLQIVFLDTPGLISPRYLLQEAMMDAASLAIEDGDVLVYMVDLPKVVEDINGAIRSEALDRMRRTRKPVFLVLNKTDRAPKAHIPSAVESLTAAFAFKKIFLLSALTGEGIPELVQALTQELPEHPPYYPLDIVSEQSQRFFTGEIIREKIFLFCHEEIPYSTSVDIIEFKERDGHKWFISADIYVERASQKGILIGAHGGKLKEIGKAARQDIERMLEHPVYLDLHVKVREKWREKEEWLKRLGYR